MKIPENHKIVMQQVFGSTVAKSIGQAAQVPEVRQALVRWVRSTTPTTRGVLIGALALAFYARPRQTSDIDLLFLHVPDLSEVEGFKHNRPHAAIDLKTRVEVEMVTPELIGLPIALAHKVIHSAVEHDGLKVASMEAVIAMKLHSAHHNLKRKHKDLGDVQSILEEHPTFNIQVMHEWNLPKDQVQTLQELIDLR